MQDSDMIIVNGTQTSNGDENLLVKFTMEDVLNNFKTEQAGHPVHDKELFISIISPGTNLMKTDRPANEADKERFPKQWQSFLNKENVEFTGMPIGEWPMLTRNQIEELKAQKFYSVELLANASDAQLNGIGPIGFSLRTKAAAFLKVSKDTAEAQRLAAENERLNADINLLKEQVANLSARLENGTPEKRPVGRPRKLAIA